MKAEIFSEKGEKMGEEIDKQTNLDEITVLEKLDRIIDKGINIADLRYEFDDAIDLTKNNVDFSVFMLRDKNYIVIYCTGDYSKDYIIKLANEEKAKTLVEIAKKLSEELFDQLAFSADDFVEFIKNTLDEEIEVKELVEE